MSNSEFEDMIFSLFKDFMTGIAKFEELVPVGSTFLNGFQHALEFLRRPLIDLSSELVKNIVQSNGTERVKSHLEAGGINTDDGRHNITKLLNFMTLYVKEKSILNELECLLEDASGATQDISLFQENNLGDRLNEAAGINDKVIKMTLLSKARSVLRQTANRQSIHHAIRCASSMGTQEALRGGSYSTDEQSLRKAFAKSGEVDGKTFMDRDTGRSAGLGLLTSGAIRPLDGQELGRQVRLNNATIRPGSNFGTEGVVGYYGQHGLAVGYGLRSYGGVASDKSIIGGGADKFGVGQRRSISTGSTGNTKSGVDSTSSKLGRIAASYLPSLTVFPHIASGIEGIMADYVHQKMTKEFISIAFSLFLIIVIKDVFLFLAF